MEDGIDDSVNALHIHKADHRPRSPTHFHKATLDNISRPQLPPQMFGEAEERQQVRQIFLELLNQARILTLPAQFQ